MGNGDFTHVPTLEHTHISLDSVLDTTQLVIVVRGGDPVVHQAIRQTPNSVHGSVLEVGADEPIDSEPTREYCTEGNVTSGAVLYRIILADQTTERYTRVWA